MFHNIPCLLLIALTLRLASTVYAQVTEQNRDLVINGHSGQATIVVIAGKMYIDLDTLARIANGSLTYQGNQVSLTLPESGNNHPVHNSATAEQPSPARLSREFLQAG